MFRDICEWDDKTGRPAWDAHFDAFASSMKDTGAPRLELAAPPLPGQSLVVTVDGAPVTAGWTYDAEAGEVVFDPGSFRFGADVEITYEAAPESCE